MHKRICKGFRWRNNDGWPQAAAIVYNYNVETQFAKKDKLRKKIKDRSKAVTQAYAPIQLEPEDPQDAIVCRYAMNHFQQVADSDVFIL